MDPNILGHCCVRSFSVTDRNSTFLHQSSPRWWQTEPTFKCQLQEFTKRGDHSWAVSLWRRRTESLYVCARNELHSGHCDSYSCDVNAPLLTDLTQFRMKLCNIVQNRSGYLTLNWNINATLRRCHRWSIKPDDCKTNLIWWNYFLIQNMVCAWINMIFCHNTDWK